MALDSCECPSWGLVEHKNVPISSGENILIPAAAGHRYHVIRFMLSGDATVRYDLYSGSNLIFSFYGPEYFGIPLMAEDKHIGIFMANVGEALRLVASGAVNANVYLQYQG